MVGILEMTGDSTEKIVHIHLIFWDKVPFLIGDCVINFVKLRTNCTIFSYIILVGENHQIYGLTSTMLGNNALVLLVPSLLGHSSPLSKEP